MPFTAKRSVLIGARQTEDHWKPPDRESVGAKAQDKVSASFRLGRQLGYKTVMAPWEAGAAAPSPTLDTHAPSRSRRSLCGQDMCSAEQVTGRWGRRKRHAGEEAWQPRSHKLMSDRKSQSRKLLAPSPSPGKESGVLQTGTRPRGAPRCPSGEDVTSTSHQDVSESTSMLEG